MSRVLTNEQNYYDIADTIRQMKNVETTYKPREMASALKDIYSNEAEGTLPLSFEANGNNLLNYRIDGASGGVGDRTKNLVDKTKFTYGYRLGATGALYTTPSEQNLFAVSGFIKVNANEQYIISQRSSIGGYARRIAFYREEEESTWISNNDDSDLSFTVPNEALYLRFTTIQSVVDNIMLSKGTSLPDTYEPYGYKVPVVVSGKNLLQNKATSITLNGVTCTVNDDKSVTFTGSPERSFDLIFNNSLILNPGTYIYTNGLTQSYSRIRVDMYVVGTGGNINYWANPSVTFTIANTYKFVSRIFIQGNAGELAGLTIYPMVRESSITDDTYEPYIEPTTTNIYLDEPILENESISLSDTNTNIPTLDGTNTLSIDTTVQPSNVYVQAPKDAYPKDIVNTKFAMSTFTTIPNTIQNLNWHKVVDMSYMFAGCSNLTTVPVLDTSKATNMCYMFIQCSNLTTIPLLDTSNVENMEGMFSDCANLTTIPLLDTSNVENMKGMFSDCANLTTIPLLDTGKVERTREMFSGCVNLTTIPLIDTGNVFDAFHMFYGCVNLTTIPLLDLSNLSTEYMFSNCPSLSNESLNNILLMCTTATKMYIKTLKIMGLTSSQATICESLSNYQAFINAGWTTGY